jgi:hypothetical protein
MRGPVGATLRNLVPGLAVASVLALAFIATPQALGSASAAYGYAYNCGVKGNGFHDHGKPCPNRPFPGKGKGVLQILGTTVPTTSSQTDVNSQNDSTATTTDESTSATSTSDQGGLSTGQGLGNGHSHGKGHGNSRGNV